MSGYNQCGYEVTASSENSASINMVWQVFDNLRTGSPNAYDDVWASSGTRTGILRVANTLHATLARRASCIEVDSESRSSDGGGHQTRIAEPPVEWLLSVAIAGRDGSLLESRSKKDGHLGWHNLFIAIGM